MSCLPGMPCYDAYRIAFPFSCGDPCQSLCLTSDKIIYNGPNLACTGIQSQDNLEVALQKIDDRMCSDEFISHIIVAIEDNPVLKAYFCQLVSSCPITTTTTSSTSSTTTTTTTATPTTTTTTTQTPTTTTTTTAEPTTTTTTTIEPTTTTTTTTTTSSTTTTTTTVAPIPPGTYTIGEAALGGKIAYVLQPGDPGYDAGSEHGIVAAVSDTSFGSLWGCDGTLISGADGILLGTGNQNTIDIVTGCPTAGIAARLCSDLTEGGYSDWYLPSKDELNKLYLNRVAIGGFIVSTYWSSSEFNAFSAWLQIFSTGSQLDFTKTSTSLVRAIRSF